MTPPQGLFCLFTRILSPQAPQCQPGPPTVACGAQKLPRLPSTQRTLPLQPPRDRSDCAGVRWEVQLGEPPHPVTLPNSPPYTALAGPAQGSPIPPTPHHLPLHPASPRARPVIPTPQLGSELLVVVGGGVTRLESSPPLSPPPSWDQRHLGAPHWSPDSPAG